MLPGMLQTVESCWKASLKNDCKDAFSQESGVILWQGRLQAISLRTTSYTRTGGSSPRIAVGKLLLHKLPKTPSIEGGLIRPFYFFLSKSGLSDSRLEGVPFIWND